MATLRRFEGSETNTETNLPLVKRRPFTAPKVEQATKTGTIQCTGPKNLVPTLWKINIGGV